MRRLRFWSLVALALVLPALLAMAVLVLSAPFGVTSPVAPVPGEHVNRPEEHGPGERTPARDPDDRSTVSSATNGGSSGNSGPWRGLGSPHAPASAGSTAPVSPAPERARAATRVEERRLASVPAAMIPAQTTDQRGSTVERLPFHPRRAGPTPSDL